MDDVRLRMTGWRREEVKSHVFEPFFTTKVMGSGTTFRIYLPRVEEEASKMAREDPPQLLPGGFETVLLVEDEDMVRDLAVRVLEESGYKVLHASNGQAAIALSRGHDGGIDLLMTDVVMPGMNGGELANQLILQRPEMKVLFSSGYTEDVIVHHGILDDEVSFLGKPYSPSVLAKKIREVLDAPE